MIIKIMILILMMILTLINNIIIKKIENYLFFNILFNYQLIFFINEFV